MQRMLGIAMLSSVLITGASAKVGSVAREDRPPPHNRVAVSGLDEAGMDKAVAPGVDFYAYANGLWTSHARIPPDDSFYSRTSPVRATTARRVFGIIEKVSRERTAAGSPEGKIATLFKSFMNVGEVERRGGSPLKPYLRAIDRVRSRAELAAAFAEADRYGVITPVNTFVQQDYKHALKNSAYIQQSGLGLPDRRYYLSQDPDTVAIRRRYRNYVATLLKLAGRRDSRTAAARVIAIETALAKAHWPASETRDTSRLYNPVRTADFGNLAPGIDWKALFSASGLQGQATIIVFEPDAVAAEARVVASTPLRDWRDYLAFHYVAHAAPYLSKEYVEADFAMNGAALWGAEVLPSREKRAVQLIDSAMGQAVGKLYVAKYFRPAAKSRADGIVRNLIAAMDLRLSRLTWMDPATRTAARAKLANMIPKIGYPDVWLDYAGLQVVAGDVLGNALRAQAFARDRKFDGLGRAVDRSRWSMNPQTVNAYASAPSNDVVFPAAIMQRPYFDPDGDAAANYGALGAVIGHEIIHNFDDRGALFDVHGDLKRWWTDEDAKRFNAEAERLVMQFGSYEPTPGARIDGRLTLSENMADLAGVTVALDAYHASLHGLPAPVISGLSGDQRFFLAYAQLFASKYREAALRAQIKTDPHSPSPWRVNVLRNIDAWYDAFNISRSDPQYLPANERVRIW